MFSDWRCDLHGPVPPLHIAEHIGPDILAAALGHVSELPVWCPWPLLTGWMVTGIGWAGDDRTGTTATALACSGPAPVSGGPADIPFVAGGAGVGVGNPEAGLAG